jgi:hypothetical protein
MIIRFSYTKSDGKVTNLSTCVCDPAKTLDMIQAAYFLDLTLG